MRGQLIGLLNSVGKVLIFVLILFVVIGYIVGAGLIDNTNPFYDIWTKYVNFGGIAFTLGAISLIALVGYWIMSRVM